MVLKQAIFLIGALALSGESVAETKYFRNLAEIEKHFVNELRTSKGRSVNRKGIVALDFDLNRDGKKDYWVVHSSLQCTHSECWGYAYFKTNKGYCLAGKGIKQSDLYKEKWPTKLTCKSRKR